MTTRLGTASARAWTAKASSGANAPDTFLRQQLRQAFQQAPSTPSARAPHAEFSPVPETRQAAVAASLKKSLSALLALRPNSDRGAAVQELLTHVGEPDFYEVLATRDPARAASWHEMARVQRQFAAAEPGYDEKTRAYSESMRLTLHAAVLQHFADPALNQGQALYDRFIELHPTAFHQNGGWVDNLQIPASGALAVAEATPFAMATHLTGLLQGACLEDSATVTAAQLVRQARRDALSSGWTPPTR